MTIKPIKPADLVKAKRSQFPDFVMETWNAAIAKSWSGNSSCIQQPDIVNALVAASPTVISRNEVFANNWLDIEDVYRSEGWLVDYDKPGYNESYDANFVFKKK